MYEDVTGKCMNSCCMSSCALRAAPPCTVLCHLAFLHNIDLCFPCLLYIPCFQLLRWACLHARHPVGFALCNTSFSTMDICCLRAIHLCLSCMLLSVSPCHYKHCLEGTAFCLPACMPSQPILYNMFPCKLHPIPIPFQHACTPCARHSHSASYPAPALTCPTLPSPAQLPCLPAKRYTQQVAIHGHLP